MYRALYRKWRPTDFDDMVGQEQVTEILKYEVANGKVSHAYLFCGSRGTGKTSSARILAKAVNCERPHNGNPCNECESCRSIEAGSALDIIEMDAASNTGVDDVREIRDDVIYSPAALKYRVYIIDEVHMLSPNAFNALLKTLEEPPEHVVFILATTEPHKLLPTIVSRCQRFDFRRLSLTALSGRLAHIAEGEGIDLTKDGALLISRLAEGGMRDAISLLELCAGHGEQVTEELVSRTCGSGNKEQIYSVIEAVLGKDYPSVYRAVHEVFSSSKDITVFWQELLNAYRDMMVMKSDGRGAEYLELTEGEAKRLKELSSKISLETMLYHTEILEDAAGKMLRPGVSRRSTAELALTRLSEPKLSTGNEALLARIAELERRLSLLEVGGPSSPARPAVTPPKAEAAPAADSAPSAPSAPKEAAPPQANEPYTEETVENWQEIVDDLVRGRPGIAGLLKDTHAVLASDGTLTVYVGNPFFASMLSREDHLSAIRAVSASLLDRSVIAVRIKEGEGKRPAGGGTGQDIRRAFD